MSLSSPIYRLKREARQRARALDIPLCEALDQIAAREGYASWSLLVARPPRRSEAEQLLATLERDELLLVGARPGQGKTRFSLELAVAAARSGRRAVFFTLEYHEAHVLGLIRSLGEDPLTLRDRLVLDTSDEICASYIEASLSDAPPGALVVVDYLQLLDQRRVTPPLLEQVRSLRAFAAARGLVMVFITQIHRRFEASARACPTIEDVRLPNPLDLQLFHRACFLHEGRASVVTL